MEVGKVQAKLSDRSIGRVVRSKRQAGRSAADRLVPVKTVRQEESFCCMCSFGGAPSEVTVL